MIEGRHICGICQTETQTHGAACTKCKKRIMEQSHRYLDLADKINLEMGLKFETYQARLEGKK